ncbi:autotransporter assembly complex protein TamA [Pseudomonas sp. SP16.1]|uniref:autotransporter assembly complex protein TamA n=1 Tax=Pseudomonas sp. SP16.1 TaxID=3458854 RepID=UPI0040461DA6
MSVYGYLRRSLALLLVSTGVVAGAELEVRITPADSALKANIEGYVGSLEGRDGQALRRLRRVAETEADKAAEALGYYQARIRSHVEEGDPPRLVLEVEPGERVRLREVSIRIEGPASEVPAFRIPSASRLQPGAALHHGRYEDAKRLIQNRASRYGFFDGHFSRQRLDIDPAAGVADIELVYLSGPRYRLGDIAFSGDFPFDEDLLRRMVPFQADTPYDAELIAELYQTLQSSGYFETVRVDAIPAQAEQLRIPVQVTLQARQPRTLGFGLGFSTDVGPRLRGNWTRHWRNPQGHSYGLESELSAPRQNLGLWYDIPGDPPLTDKLRLAGGYQYEELASNDSLSRLLKVGPEWHSRRAGGWQRVLSIKWQREEYRLGDDSGLSTLLMPGVSYSLLRSDNRLDPRRGYRLQFGLSGAVDGVLSDADLVHGNVMLKGLTTVLDNHRLLGRVQLGGTETDGFSGVPPSLRFFAGGDQSVRGYDYQSLSPENGRGDKIGGRYLFAASAEYQYSLSERWRLAAFVDQGNAFDSLEFPTLKTGVGFGVRWVSPVGPLRLDLAHALDDEGGVRLHFSMGPEL